MAAPGAAVASDLDRTLIYSSAALALTMPDARAPRLLCVEVHEARPLSYMTETAAALLTELGDTAHFVPTTTRTRKQYQRVGPARPRARIAICANGGHLLVDGVSDPDWHAAVTARLADECAPLAEVRDHLVATADPAWVRKHRVAEDLFAYLVVERRAAARGVGEGARRLGGEPWLDGVAAGPQDLRRAEAAHQERGRARGRPPHRRPSHARRR